MKLYSPEEVQAMFPDNRRPALKRLIARAKEAGCCCKLAVVDERYGHLEISEVHDFMRNLAKPLQQKVSKNAK